MLRHHSGHLDWNEFLSTNTAPQKMSKDVLASTELDFFFKFYATHFSSFQGNTPFRGIIMKKFGANKSSVRAVFDTFLEIWAKVKNFLKLSYLYLVARIRPKDALIFSARGQAHIDVQRFTVGHDCLYRTRANITGDLYIFFPVFHCGLYCSEVYNEDFIIFSSNLIRVPSKLQPKIE